MNNKIDEGETITAEEVSAMFHVSNREPPPGKGLIHWEAFFALSEEQQLISTIKQLPREDRIDILVSRLLPPQLQYLDEVLGAWLQAAEKFLGQDNPKIRKKFVALANRWHNETDYLSSPSSITNNDTYMKIISMGEVVIPLILKDLRERGGNWYRALRILSDEDPVSPEVRGEVPKMKDAWLSWGRDKGYIK